MEIVEIEAKNWKLRVYDNKVNGCQRHNKDIMVTLPVPPTQEHRDVEFIDIFFTTEQAERLIKGLEIILEKNKNNK